MADRIAALLAELTLDEKASLLAGCDLWSTPALPRLGIPALRMSDGPNGARGRELRGGPTSVCFPCGASLAASFDPALAERIGAALAEEAKSKGAHLLLAPTVNIQRTPIGGRDFECHSEDPHLAARMAVALVRGLQGAGVGACVKHFACNDTERERHTASSEVDERTLREIYLVPFEAAVREAGAWSVMAAYNRLGGTHCTEHERLLGEILRAEWGFDGLVVSDWFATRSTAASACAGMDLEMPGPPRHYGPKLAEAVRGGRVPEAAVDESVRRLLHLMQRTGAFDTEPAGERAVDRPEHRALVREAAAAGCVLLRNEDRVLPFDAALLRSLAVIGPNAGVAVIQGGGSARVSPHYAVTPLEGIRARCGASIDVVFERGCSNHRGVPPLAPPGGLEVELFDGAEPAGPPALVQHARAGDLLWLSPPPPLAVDRPFSARVRAHFTASVAGPHRLSLASAGRSRLRVDGREAIDNWTKQERGSAFFGFGSREVTADVELRAGQSVALEVDFLRERPGLAGLRIGCLAPEPPDAMERAVAAARDADAAVVVVGLNEDWESEGHDREGLGLPGRQDELVSRVAAANPRTVVVVNAGSPVAMDWAEQVPAILQLWYPGQECGNALADVLFGDADPGGRLPLTIPRRLEDTPAFHHYPPRDGVMTYGEGLFVGHRGYDRDHIEPRFPFGHGLSYGRFELGALRLDRERVRAGESVGLSVELRNAGSRGGSEVVQVYVRELEPKRPRPERELRAFAKVQLDAGGRRTLHIALDPRAFAHWDVARRAWRAEPGDYEVAVGRSSRDLPLSARFRLEA
ncbi:MAG TPA: glycoside hydrolase family 3 C-terminal domain-containing protein [Myxococcota bacterium]|nr:glycoside hydrolase family 3 C-terminal domain-containing protein [Myxococcota bacterium]